MGDSLDRDHRPGVPRHDVFRPRVARIEILVESFPYAVLYSTDREHTYILAIMHLHRRPGYWQDRLR